MNLQSMSLNPQMRVFVMARHYIIQDELHYLKCNGCGRIFFENMESEVIKRDVEDLAAERGWATDCAPDRIRVDLCPDCLRAEVKA